MTKKKRTISILGSTGSIGVQTLNVLESISDNFRIAYLTANTNIDLLAKQIKKFKPVGVVVGNKELSQRLKSRIDFNGIVLYGKKGLIEAASDNINDLVLSALVGFSGVEPTMAAINAGTTIALANKETLVSAGSVIISTAKKNNVDIIAIDSEHSAVLQCLVGESIDSLEKIILTASGGPFFNLPKEQFNDITLQQALNHPNWNMGNKITIDSATMMNKGFEVIEAFWLFNVKKEQIDVVIHPQSIVHSLVQFIDGSMKAQLGLPDMRIPISYALSYPRRLKFDFPRLELHELNQLTFHKPDLEKFRCLRLAFEALKLGGTSATIINAANEIAVYSFLKEQIGFTDIPKLIEMALEKIEFTEKPSLQEIIDTDLETRKYIENIIKKL